MGCSFWRLHKLPIHHCHHRMNHTYHKCIHIQVWWTPSKYDKYHTFVFVSKHMKKNVCKNAFEYITYYDCHYHHMPTWHFCHVYVERKVAPLLQYLIPRYLFWLMLPHTPSLNYAPSNNSHYQKQMTIHRAEPNLHRE